METVKLSGADFGGRTITGTFEPGQEIKVIENEIALRYRVVNGQAVYEGGEFSGNEITVTPDPITE